MHTMIEVKLSGRGVDGYDRIVFGVEEGGAEEGVYSCTGSIAYILTWYDNDILHGM